MDPELRNVLYVVAAALAVGAMVLGYIGAQPVYYQKMEVRYPGVREQRWATVPRPTPADWDAWVARAKKALPADSMTCVSDVQCSVYGSCVGEVNCTVLDGVMASQYARCRIERGPPYALALLGFGPTP